MRGAIVALLVALPACGRVGFDPTDGDPSSTGDASTARDAPQPMPCTAAGLTCDGATAGIKSCDGTCVAFCNQAVTRTVADARCADWSGAITSVGSTSELDCLATLPTNDAWVGLDQPPGATQVGDGWTWVDGTPGPGLPWVAGEPDDGDSVEDGAEQCAVLAGGGAFIDLPCAEAKPFICERPAPP